MMEYPALFEPANEGGFVITFPDFDWGVTQGDTEQEALGMAADALSMMLWEHIRKGEELPRPSRPRGRKYRSVRLPALQGIKAELYMAFRASGIKKAELARRLGLAAPNVDRLFDLKHKSRLDQIEAAFHALGRNIEFQITRAA